MSSGWAAVVVAALVAAFAALAAVFRGGARWSSLEYRLAALTRELGRLADEIKDDRRQTTERLRWLERRSYRDRR